MIQEGLPGLDQPVDRLLPELADRRVLVPPDGPLDETVTRQDAVVDRPTRRNPGSTGPSLASAHGLRARPTPTATASEDSIENIQTANPVTARDREPETSATQFVRSGHSRIVSQVI